MKLISIQVPSNKPLHFRRLIENLYETAADPNCFEVVVKIDIDDTEMQAVVADIKEKIDVNLQVVVSPKPKSYFHVWECMQEILDASDPEYYFCWHINDEILIETPEWDRVLEKYIGFFPDHLFRLKISPNKFLNIHSIHEVCWAADFPIVPRRWLDASGNWADYHGADSYQEGIAFYLGRYCGLHRNIPLLDFKLGGDEPGENLDTDVEEHRNRWVIYHWDKSMAHQYQEDYFRRARRLELTAVAHSAGLADSILEDVMTTKSVTLRDGHSKKIIDVRSFKLNRISVFIEHFRYVLKRQHPQNLSGKSPFFKILIYSAKLFLALMALAELISKSCLGLFISIYYVTKLDWQKAPLVCFYRRYFIDRLPLSTAIPENLTRAIAWGMRPFPSIHGPLRQMYLHGITPKSADE